MSEQFTYVLSDQIEVIEQFNPRREENYDVENLYHSIKEQNILTPLLVMKSNDLLEDGRPVFKLFEGHRRLKTLCLIESEENAKRQIPVRIFEKMTEDELLMKALMLGITGKQLKTSEKARAIAKLQSFGYDNKKIADLMQITTANVSTLKKFEKIPVSLQIKIDDELISFSETIKLMEQVKNVKTLEKIIEQAIENKGGKIYSRDIKELVSTSDDEEIKIVNTVITNDIKAKQIVDEEIPILGETPQMTTEEDNHIPQGKNLLERFNIDSLYDEDSDTVNNEDYNHTNQIVQNNELSEDELNHKKPKNNSSKNKEVKSSLYKLYEYLTNEQVIKILNPNSDKLNLLKSLIDYQHGLMSKDEICDCFVDN